MIRKQNFSQTAQHNLMDKANIKHIRAASEIKNDIMDIQNQEDDFGAQANSNIKKRGHSLGNTNQ